MFMRPSSCFLVLLCVSLTAGAKPLQFNLPALSRADFNRLAVKAHLPLFWVQDRDRDGLLDPAELAVTGAGQGLKAMVKKGGFTKGFITQYRALVELRRQEAVARELDSGRPTLVLNDFSKSPSQDRAVLKHLLAAAGMIEEIYARQTGAFGFRKQVAQGDAASKTLFWRNHGPWCRTPATTGDHFCNAVPTFPPKRSDAYPGSEPQGEAMCKGLEKHADAKQLLNPFTVVRRLKTGKLKALPLTKVYGAQMKKVAAKLKAAAKALANDPTEKAFHAYLLAAAEGFITNKWEQADEAWAAMNAANSKWYLRVGPDEVYFDPCQQKAGFHMALARINRQSVEWQQKLTPIRKEMEQKLARHIGKPYAARDVRFHMPDFIDVVLNAGDSRHHHGAVIGQSLPNWGKVAREGRGRTVVMANLYTDADSKRISRLKAEALLSKETMKHYTDNPRAFLLNIILHEASHNFGPHSAFRIQGKTPKELFGGKLASTLEELKAQTGGLWFLDLLRKKGLITQETIQQAYTLAVTWCFGHIARGMFTPSGNVRPYSQLAAVQIGAFVKDGALRFNKGKFTINYKKLPGSIHKLMKQVGRIKATGDVAGANKLLDYYIKGKGKRLVHVKRITEEQLRHPKATFLYSVVY